MNIITTGTDLAYYVFALHGVGATGKPLLAPGGSFAAVAMANGINSNLPEHPIFGSIPLTG